jgi:hypothetical protein
MIDGKAIIHYLINMTIWKIGKVIPLLSKCMNKGSTGTVIVMPFCPIQCVQLMIGITTMAFVERTIRQEIYSLRMRPAGSDYTLYHIDFMKSEIGGIDIIAKSFSCTEEVIF